MESRTLCDFTISEGGTLELRIGYCTPSATDSGRTGTPDLTSTLTCLSGRGMLTAFWARNPVLRISCAVVMRQIARLVSGAATDDDSFRERWKATLARLAEALAPRG